MGLKGLRMDVYFGHHIMTCENKNDENSRSLSNPSTLVLIVKLLRQAFRWYHWHSD
jgi:hypothetical protein